MIVSLSAFMTYDPLCKKTAITKQFPPGMRNEGKCGKCLAEDI